MTLGEVKKLYVGLGRLSYDEFRFAIRSSLPHASEQYLKDVWPIFCGERVGFMLSRQPIEQGEALFSIAMRHTRKKQGVAT